MVISVLSEQTQAESKADVQQAKWALTQQFNGSDSRQEGSLGIFTKRFATLPPPNFPREPTRFLANCHLLSPIVVFVQKSRSSELMMYAECSRDERSSDGRGDSGKTQKKERKASSSQNSGANFSSNDVEFPWPSKPPPAQLGAEKSERGRRDRGVDVPLASGSTSMMIVSM